MNVLIAAALIVIGFVFLVKGADLFVDNASGIAKKLGVSPVVIGLTIARSEPRCRSWPSA